MKPSLTPLGLALLIFAGAAITASAATITVTNGGDSGAGTLRQAITDAADGDTIQFNGGISTITLTSGEILIDKNTTIQGPGANKLTVKRDSNASNFRIFEVASGKTVVISGLTISGGSVTDAGGAIFTRGTVTINDSVLFGNHVDDGGGGTYAGSTGGAIDNRGMLTINNSTLSGNSASNAGGALFNTSPTTINNSTLSGNTAGVGGAIYGSSVVTINNSTLSGNSARANGFGSAGSGGGIFYAASLVLNNSTVVGNSATGDGGGLGRSVGGGAGSELNSTIVANNTAGGTGPDCNYAISLGDYYLIRDTSGIQSGGLPGSHYITGQDPLLGPLADNGGPTQTHALLKGSPAINVGKNVANSQFDQRGLGFKRTLGPAKVSGGDGTDIGAFEFKPTDFDAVADFSSTLNDTNQVWQYGETDANGAGFTLFTQLLDFFADGRLTGWSDGAAKVLRNNTGQDIDYYACTRQQADVLGMFPRSDCAKSVVRWVAPENAAYSFTGRFQNIDQAKSEATIVQNGNTAHPLIDPIHINAANSCHTTTDVEPFSFTLSVNAGDTIDFQLGCDGAYYNNDGTGFAASIMRIGPPAPPHGGVSTTVFSINGSNSPPGNLADTVLRFTAQQTGTAADLVVRVEATTTPGIEGSWTTLPDGGNGAMSFDASSGQYILDSCDYPQQNGVYFRAIASASGYPDNISDPVPPVSQPGLNLAPNKPHLPATRLFFKAGGPLDDIYFLASVSGAPSGVAVRIQSSTDDPTNEGSWSDLNDGNTPYTQRSTNGDFPDLFILTTHNMPTVQNIHFRAVASLDGYVDSISNAVGPYNITRDVPPAVTVHPPDGLTGSGDGHDIDHAIIVEAGDFSFTASVISDRSVPVLAMLCDGKVVARYESVLADGNLLSHNLPG